MGKNQSLNLPYPLILASTSKYRAALLGQLGWEFEALGPEVNEEKVKEEGHSPAELAITLSRMKAKTVYLQHEGSCVIGSDQVCCIGQTIFDKPGSQDAAIEQLLLMRGKSHQLLTAVTVISPEKETTFLNTATLHMRNLGREEIERYVTADRPLDCAGSYKLESLGIKLFERLEMSDHTAIIGLPLIELTNVLMDLGYP